MKEHMDSATRSARRRTFCLPLAFLSFDYIDDPVHRNPSVSALLRSLT
jgi:hypothetical protein